MDPKIFMRGLEEQLRRVKIQYNQIQGSQVNSDLGSVELLSNARVWFLRTLENTDLIYFDAHIPALEYVVDDLFEIQKNPPYNLRYPSILWIISTMPQEQIETIFGVNFYNKLVQKIGRTENIFKNRTTVE